ncbi:MAG: hypothetical protein GQ562_05655 [Anaerolineales bacterium]|nr:hypothetical protein [Anaerolineales bacterium]
MNRQVTTSILVLCILGIGLLLSGCLSLSDDITPPPEVVKTNPVANTPILPTTPPTQEQPLPNETTPEETKPGVVFVEVSDQTGGTLLDQGLEVSLEAYDNFGQVFLETLPLPSTGFIDFNDVPFLEGRVYLASLKYGGAVYRSAITQLAPDASELALKMQIFDTTTDDSGLYIDRIHVLVDFPEPDLLQIVEIFIFSNNGEKTVVAGSPDQPAVFFPLPEGAAAIEFDDGDLGQRYLKTQNGFGDTVSIPPGSGVYQVLVYYTLPFQRNKLDFSQTINYPVGAVVVMTPVNQVEVRGNFLEDLGVQNITNNAFQVYAGGGLSRGEELQFQISENSETALIQDESSPVEIQGYLIGLIALGVVMILAGSWLFFRNRRLSGEEYELEGDQKGAEEDQDQILDQIIALENLYNSGEISEKSYLKKRQELKKKLSELVQN